MFRFLFLRVVVPLIVLLLIRSVIMTLARMFSQSFSSPVAHEPRQATPSPSGGDLKKDPVCGTYVSPGASVSKKVNGEMVHFCSPECRDKYRG